MAVGALLLAAGAFAIPQHAAAQAFGGYADSLFFTTVDQGATALLSAGEIDVYTGPLGIKGDANIKVNEAYASYYGILLNPVAPSSGDFNPFTIREIREAMHWAYDREIIIAQIAGGQPMTTVHFRGEPEFARDAPFFVAAEIQYAYDPARAKARVDEAMSIVPGASFDSATNQWLMNGVQIDVIIVNRLEDFRFEIGAYVATEVAKLGFNPVLDPSTFSEALDKVYFNDAKLGAWHMYIELWGIGDWVQFDDSKANFFYNGDFGSALWEDYAPPSSLSTACQALDDGQYVTLEERRDLLRTCVSEGMRDGVRSFLMVGFDFTSQNATLSNTVFDLFKGNLNPLSVRTTIKNGASGGTLNIGQPVHTASPWNLYGGFTDVYSRHQLHSITDFGTLTHPHLGVKIPFRADFAVHSVGPADTYEVPTSALTYNVVTNLFENVSSGVTSSAYVDFTMKWGEWHHGETMSMDDVVAHLAMLSRLAFGDIASRNPRTANQIYVTRWETSFRGFEILDAERIRIWYDAYNPDETLIAERADVFPWYPWELNQIITESVLANETVLSQIDADLLGIEALDLAKGATLALFDPRLASHLASNSIPTFFTGEVTSAEAAARWAALDIWRHDPSGCVEGPTTWTCNYMVSQGPYVLDFTTSESAEYRAKRDGYPIRQEAWDHLSNVRVPQVDIEPFPFVVQTFPATFRFTSTLEGAPYDRIQTAAWLIREVPWNNLLFEGDATHKGVGEWAIDLTSAETTRLVGGSYELVTIVVGEEATIPVVDRQSIMTVWLGSLILQEVLGALDEALQDLRATVDESVAETQSAIDTNNAQIADLTALVTLALILAIAATTIAVALVAAMLIVWRKGPRE